MALYGSRLDPLFGGAAQILIDGVDLRGLFGR
jgi:hypothetical protein